jgi:hypothetical protein
MQFTALGVSALASPGLTCCFQQMNPSDEGGVLILSILTVGKMRLENDCAEVLGGEAAERL